MMPARNLMERDLFPASAESGVRILRTVRDVSANATEWRGLETTPATYLDGYLGGLDHDGAARPFAMLVGPEGAATALAAGRYEERRRPLRLGYWRFLGPRARCLTFEPGAIVGDLSREQSATIVRALYTALERGEADMALVRELRLDAPLFEALSSFPAPRFRDRNPVVNVRWMIEFPESPEAPLAMSAHTRKHLRYYTNRLQRKYGDRLRVESWTRPADLARLMADAEAVARTTYQRKIGVGFRDDVAARARIRLEMERGFFRSYLVYLDGRPGAFWMGSRFGDTYYSGDTGYDPALRVDRVGELLLARMLEALRKEAGLRWFDFGFGDSDYKRRYSTHSFEEATVAMFAPTARGALLNVAQSTVRGVNRAVKSTAERLELLDWIRSRLRRRWAKTASADRSPLEPEEAM
ncbi:MAG: GNAT family N-acetyltransferase [Candidatus Binatia bacterium]